MFYNVSNIYNTSYLRNGAQSMFRERERKAG